MLQYKRRECSFLEVLVQTTASDLLPYNVRLLRVRIGQLVEILWRALRQGMGRFLTFVFCGGEHVASEQDALCRPVGVFKNF